MMLLILIIIGLIAGYFFIKKYREIDSFLFSSIERYRPFGILIVYISALLGAIMGCLFLYAQMNNQQDGADFTAIFIFLALLVCIGVFQSFIYLKSAGNIIKKTLFVIVSCTLATIIGAMGSVAVICLAIIYVILVLISKAAFGDYGKQYTTTDEHGNKRTLRSEGGGSYRDDQGRSWTSGNSADTVTRDD